MDIPFELLDDDDHKRCNGSEYVQPGTKDIQVQLVISLALGISAFVIFCVSRCPRDTLVPTWSADSPTLFATDPPAAMEVALCRPQASARLDQHLAAPARLVLRMDARTLQDHRGAGPLGSRPGCLCGEFNSRWSVETLQRFALTVLFVSSSFPSSRWLSASSPSCSCSPPSF